MPPWHSRRCCGPTTRHKCGRTPAARPRARSGAPRCIERDVVRKAVHEAERPAIHRHHRDVAGQQRAAALCARAPVHDRAAGEMPAGPHQQEIVRDPMAVTGPRHDDGMRPRDERAIVAMQIDRHAAERLTPVGDRAVVMRMRDGDRLQAAERTDVVDGLPGHQRDAVPHHAAIGRGHQQRALPDRKIRLDGDAGNAEIIAPDEFVTFRHLFARKPRLAVPVDILTLVLADRARGRRRSAFGKLRAALSQVHRGIRSLQSGGVVAQNAGISQW